MKYQALALSLTTLLSIPTLANSGVTCSEVDAGLSFVPGPRQVFTNGGEVGSKILTITNETASFEFGFYQPVGGDEGQESVVVARQSDSQNPGFQNDAVLTMVELGSASVAGSNQLIYRVSQNALGEDSFLVACPDVVR